MSQKSQLNSNSADPGPSRSAMQVDADKPETLPLPNDNTLPDPPHTDLPRTHDPQANTLNSTQVGPPPQNVSFPDPPRGFQSVAQAAYFQHPEVQAQMHIKRTISSWGAPRLMEPDRAEQIRHDCERFLGIIHRMDAEKARLASKAHPELERMLKQMRLDRSIIFFQLFRINDLPTEIISNIFRYVVWSATRPDMGVLFRLRLTWTCSHWRGVAIADPTLWNAIWFRDPPPYERSLTWFDRAGTAPLDLRINECDPRWRGQEDNHKFTGAQMGSLLDRLFTKLSQIRMLIIIVDNWPPALMVLDKLRQAGNAGIPMSIERFELHRSGQPYVWIGPGYEPDAHRIPMILFGGAVTPSLRYVTVNGVHIDWNKSHLENLTTFDMRRIPLELSPKLLRFRDILKGCPNLQKLSLDGAGPVWAPEDASGLDPVNLPHLRTLVVADYSLQYALYVFSQFSAPNVRDLTLMNMVGEDYSPFFSLVTLGFPDVRLLTIYSVEVVNAPKSRLTMVKWLQSMPNVRYLRIAQVKREFLEPFLFDPRQFDTQSAATPSVTSLTRDHVLTLTQPRQNLCPKLDVLECQAVEVDLILAWGKARQAIGSPLRKIYLEQKLSHTVTREQYQVLRSLCSIFVAPAGSKTPEEDEVLR